MHCRFSSLSHDSNLKIVTRRPHLIFYTICIGRRSRLLFMSPWDAHTSRRNATHACSFVVQQNGYQLGVREFLFDKKRAFCFLPKMCVQLVRCHRRRRHQPHTHTYSRRKMNFRAHMVKSLNAFDFDAVYLDDCPKVAHYFLYSFARSCDCRRMQLKQQKKRCLHGKLHSLHSVHGQHVHRTRAQICAGLRDAQPRQNAIGSIFCNFDVNPIQVGKCMKFSASRTNLMATARLACTREKRAIMNSIPYEDNNQWR